MAALDRALALAERDERPLPVRQHLDLDVPRPLDVAFEEDAVVAERRLRLPPGRLERILELGRLPDDAHPATAAARGCLDHQGIPDLVRLAGGDDRDSGLFRDSLRLELVAAET